MSDKSTRESRVAELRLEDAPELARLLRSRLLGTAAMWAMAMAWSKVAVVSFPWVNFSIGASFFVTFTALEALRRNPSNLLAADLHVAADILIMPAFLHGVGDWKTPFVSVLVVKAVGGSLLIGRKRGTIYGFATVAAAWLLWLSSAGPENTIGLASATFAAMIVAALGAVLLQAAAFPLHIYQTRRRALATENRRLEEAIAELESQNRRLVALHELARDIGTLGGVSEVATRLRTTMLRSFPGRAVSFFLFRRESGRLEPVLLPDGTDHARVGFLTGRDGPWVNRLADGRPAPGVAAEVIDPRNDHQLRVPLMLGEKPVGLLVLEDRVAIELTGEDTQLLSTMASEMAVALRNADLHARTVDLRDSLESLIENANALIFVVDAQGRIEVSNRALTALVEPAFSLVGRPVGDLLTPGAAAEELKQALELVRGGSPVENVSLVLRKGESAEVRAVFSLAPVVSRDGTFRSAIAVGQDITRLELLEREVMHSDKLASIGQFVAGIAHEMNNPLTAITAYGAYLRDGMKKGTPGPDAAGKMDEIVVAGERIQRFVQSLLSFSRPSRTEHRLLDLNQVIQDAVRMCHYDLKKWQLEVSTDLARDLPAISGVDAELQQVFINLFVNSAQAMPPAGGRLTIVSRAVEDGARVTVSDDGRGIPPDALASIWEPFFTTKAEGQGTGLGLSIVKRVVEQHKGRIRVESVEGKGTTFTVDFPAARAGGEKRAAS